MQYIKASTFVLGKELANRFPGSKILLVMEKRNEENIRQNALIEGLKEGCDSAISDIVIDTPPAKTPKAPEGNDFPADYMDEMMNIEEIMTAQDWNKMLAKHKSCNIIISTVGLPQNAGDLKLWKEFEKNQKKCPKLVIVSGDVSLLAPFIKIGLVPAVIAYKPGVKYTDEPPPADLEKVFNMRYLLVTKKNLDQIMKQYPRIFKPLK